MDREQPDDLAAVSEVLRGNAEAYRFIIRRYRADMLRLSVFYLRTIEDAEDAVQDIFLKAYRSLHGFRLERRFRPWLYAVAVSCLKTRYRRLKNAREARENCLQETVPELAPAYRIPEEEFERNETITAVRGALTALPPKLREPAVLYYMEGLDVDQTAEALGLGRENVKSRLHRARKKLKEILTDRATEP